MSTWLLVCWCLVSLQQVNAWSDATPPEILSASPTASELGPEDVEMESVFASLGLRSESPRKDLQHPLPEDESLAQFSSADWAYISLLRTWKHSPLLRVDSPAVYKELISTAPAKKAVTGDEDATPKRPFQLVILFRSESSPGCERMSAALEGLAQRYWADREAKRAVSTSKLFFVETFDPNVLRAFRVTKVPALVVLPFDAEHPPIGAGFEPSFAFPSEAALSDLHTWISARLALQPPLNPGKQQQSIVQGLGSALTGPEAERKAEIFVKLMLLGQILVLLFSYKEKAATKSFWMWISLGVYAASVSGTVFSLLRGMPPVGMSREGMYLIYPSKDNQFVLEGFFIGMLNCICGALWVAAIEYGSGRDVLEDQGIADVDETETPADRKARLARYAGAAVFIAGLTVQNISSIFRYKAPWYQPFVALSRS